MSSEFFVRPVFVLWGDSLTQYGFEAGGWASLLAHHYGRRTDVLNRGYSGYTTNMARDLLLDKLFPAKRQPARPQGNIAREKGTNGTELSNKAAGDVELEHSSPEICTTQCVKDILCDQRHGKGDAEPRKVDFSRYKDTTANPLACAPLLVTIWFGANDSVLPHFSPRHMVWHVPIPTYKANLRLFIDRVLQSHSETRIIVITPPILCEEQYLEHCVAEELSGRGVTESEQEKHEDNGEEGAKDKKEPGSSPVPPPQQQQQRQLTKEQQQLRHLDEVSNIDDKMRRVTKTQQDRDHAWSGEPAQSSSRKKTKTRDLVSAHDSQERGGISKSSLPTVTGAKTLHPRTKLPHIVGSNELVSNGQSYMPRDLVQKVIRDVQKGQSIQESVQSARSLGPAGLGIDLLDRRNSIVKEYVDACKGVVAEVKAATLNGGRLALLDLYTDMIESCVVDGDNPGGEQANSHCRKYLSDGLHLNLEGNRFVFKRLLSTIDTHFPELGICVCPESGKAAKSTASVRTRFLREDSPWYDTLLTKAVADQHYN